MLRCPGPQGGRLAALRPQAVHRRLADAAHPDRAGVLHDPRGARRSLRQRAQPAAAEHQRQEERAGAALQQQP